MRPDIIKTYVARRGPLKPRANSHTTFESLAQPPFNLVEAVEYLPCPCFMSFASPGIPLKEPCKI